MKRSKEKAIVLCKKILGGILIIIGVILLPFPILNGTICIIAGVYLISPSHGKRLIEKIKDIFHTILHWFKK
jgi:uncharacterized membrane protein HdeD (DUF308 family)